MHVLKFRYLNALHNHKKQLQTGDKAKTTKKASQHGGKVRGISASHFIEAIQRRVDQNALAIVVQQVETSMADLLK